MSDGLTSEGLLKFAAIAAFGLAACLLALIARHSNRRARAGAGALEADLASGRIVLSGWSAAEARDIIADFAKLYGLGAETFAISGEGPVVQVTWKRPVTANTALYLVNYLTYPANRDLSGRQAVAVGVIPVPASVAPAGVAPGTLAKIFVPESDTEHDLVHALTTGGRTFRISFTRMAWEAIAAARAPSLVEQVAFKDTP
ncbi:MAG: hypothetical protein NWP98_02330 [Erythrobacter sp.]|nr:hypothetical protein [Erythrobacter sp.]